MSRMTSGIASLLLGAAVFFGVCQTASAEDYTGSVVARVGVTVVDPDSSADVYAGGARLAGASAEVSTEVVPSLTLAYFLTNNLAVELFCCFAKHDVDGKGTLNGVDLGDTWIFPPALTLQYHFHSGRGFKPYVGAGVQYIAFFDEGRSTLAGNPNLDIDSAFGFTLQAGVALISAMAGFSTVT
ncbi:MAG: outer membrane beta-barrel protein [Hyphomicrobiales bacterium]|nr:outer membrane beta-barrel protein [Hyphomicrobiales bacterium]